MSFGCECGYTWKGVLPETRDHQGDYFSLVEREQWLEEAAEAINSFVVAAASGQRDRWFDESEYFNEIYPRELPDGEVIHDILAASWRDRGVDVYRCPQCRRVYIQERLDANRWLAYQYVERSEVP